MKGNRMKRKLSPEVISLTNELFHAKQRLKACVMRERIRKLYTIVSESERKIKVLARELEYNIYEHEFLFPLVETNK